MIELIVSRHGESTYSADNRANGDPDIPVPLTPAGREQAASLGKELAAEHFNRCVTSRFLRTQQTADMALHGRTVARVVDSRFDDIRYGTFEGQSLDCYKAWANSHSFADAIPGDGESRLDLLVRSCQGFRSLLTLPEETVLLVTHDKIVKYLLDSLQQEPPDIKAAKVPYATPYRVSSADLEKGLAFLTNWIDRVSPGG